MKKPLLAFTVAAAVTATTTIFSVADDHKEGEKKGLSHERMEEIMKVGFKSDKRKGTKSLLDRITEGTATKKESKQFMAMLLDLESHHVEKGTQEDYVGKTDALVYAMAGVLAQKDGSVDALKKAANCKACHEAHRE
jgi:predicted RNase H-related nuclease YkuK (DUF458 family)